MYQKCTTKHCEVCRKTMGKQIQGIVMVQRYCKKREKKRIAIFCDSQSLPTCSQTDTRPKGREQEWPLDAIHSGIRPKKGREGVPFGCHLAGGGVAIDQALQKKVRGKKVAKKMCEEKLNEKLQKKMTN